ncbi:MULTISPECIES: hypothetical protein [unclassified Thioalkalivibrio]|uniref:hypothetical protein n=1 Tax=unclassified Thioalkalivibrio TaxID=2621013 RepID=UPI00036000BB|nr:MULTISPECIES: hypothetical protein [unclassified Thioalkalivibrio]
MSRPDPSGDYGPGAYRSNAIPPLPAPPRARDRFGETLLPFGDYAHIDPHQRVLEDAEFVQHQEQQDPEFHRSDDWWWDHERIRFLKSQLGLSVLILAVPVIYVFALLAIPFFFADQIRAPLLEYNELLGSTVIALILLGGVLGALVIGAYTTQPLMIGLIHLGAFLLKPFHGVIAARSQRYLDNRRSEFNRRTGRVRFARGRRKPPLEAPFVEFDAYLERVVQRGGIFYRLMFVHRYSGEQFNRTSLSGVVDHDHEVRALWDMIQRYMDITQPMPDVPRLEPFRARDPVTAEHDRQTGRDPRFWRDLDLEAWKSGEGAERRRAQARFPWRNQRCPLTPQIGRIGMDAYRQQQARLHPDPAA